MSQLTDIAAQIAGNLCSGIPVTSSDILDGLDPAKDDETRKACKAVAQISVMMAQGILEEIDKVEKALRQAQGA